MPVKDLVNSLDCAVPRQVHEVSEGLVYRDFITVGLLVKKLEINDGTDSRGLVNDNWIYIQEPDVTAGRLQIFNNWSPFLVGDPDKVWLGWNTSATRATISGRGRKRACGTGETSRKIGIRRQSDVRDDRGPHGKDLSGVLRHLRPLRGSPRLRGCFPNLYLVGRNGMHHYNNQDHSMLTAMTAVDNILAGRTDKRTSGK